MTREQALDYFQSPDLIGLGFEADAVRRRLHPEGVVSYIIDRNINYTNFCTEYCTFCAFYRPLKGPQAKEGYILDFEKIYEKIAETVEMGGTGVLMQGGIHPDLKIDWFERLFRGIKERFPQIWLHCLSASEVLAIAEYSELSLRDTIMRLRDAGLDSIPGGGAEILDDDVRKRIARLKCRTEDWVSVHRTAHQLGMRTTATMMFGVGETFEQRVNHFEVVRRLQEETGGFTAFIPWSFQPKNTALGGRGWDEATSVEYLKVLAISRLYLDNIDNVQAELGHTGPEGSRTRPSLRRQRCRLSNARGERGKGGGHLQLHYRRRAATHHSRCRLQARTTRYALPHDVPELIRPTDRSFTLFGMRVSPGSDLNPVLQQRENVAETLLGASLAARQIDDKGRAFQPHDATRQPRVLVL